MPSRVTRRKKPASGKDFSGASASGNTNDPPKPKRYIMEATAYGPPWGGINGTGITSEGVDLSDGPCDIYVVAVDPTVIPMKSQVKVDPNPHNDPNRVYIAADVGGAIKGKRIDVYHCDRQKQLQFGRRKVKVTVYPPGSGNWDASGHPSASGSIGDVVPDIGELVKFVARLFEPEFWARVGKTILGVMAISFAVYVLMKALFGIDMKKAATAVATKGAKK